MLSIDTGLSFCYNDLIDISRMSFPRRREPTDRLYWIPDQVGDDKNKKMKVQIKKIEDKKTEVPVNSEFHRIEQIKEEIAKCPKEIAVCQIEVFDMWSDLPDPE